jgi:hypothetical protein
MRIAPPWSTDSVWSQVFVLSLASAVALAGAGGGPTVYVVGNLEGVSPGEEGTLVLDHNAVVFRSGKTVLSLPYSDIHNVELGTRVMPPSDAPLYKVWRLPKRFLTERAMHQMVNFEFADKDGNDQSMTLEFEETAANQTLVEIEMRQGKRTPPKHPTNGDAWWGDSAWKTGRNNNMVTPGCLGNSAGK